MRQVFLDTETTGLDPNQGHRIIEIAAVEINNRQLSENQLDRHQQYYQPLAKPLPRFCLLAPPVVVCLPCLALLAVWLITHRPFLAQCFAVSCSTS